jgi:hypothetical protein
VDDLEAEITDHVRERVALGGESFEEIVEGTIEYLTDEERVR